MNDEQFEAVLDFIRRNWNSGGNPVAELRARDTVQREAIEAWKAAQAREAAALALAWEQRDAVQAQLAEVVGLINQHFNDLGDACCSFESQHDVDTVTRFLDVLQALLARQAQVEHQEAQGEQAGEFKREDRYIVIKRKDLDAAPMKYREWFKGMLAQLEPHLPKREYLVIESDWPEYEPTWEAIQARVEGRAALATQPATSMPAEISLQLMVKIIDEVFYGGLEDSSVISDIYRVIARECSPAVRGAEQ